MSSQPQRDSEGASVTTYLRDLLTVLDHWEAALDRMRIATRNRDFGRLGSETRSLLPVLQELSELQVRRDALLTPPAASLGELIAARHPELAGLHSTAKARLAELILTMRVDSAVLARHDEETGELLQLIYQTLSGPSGDYLQEDGRGAIYDASA